MFEEVKCFLCKSVQNKRYISVQDRLSNESNLYNIVKCECDFIYLNPRPTQSNISQFYNIKNYEPHNENKNSLWNYTYQFIQRIIFYWKLSKINNFKKRGNLLDIGGGNGEFADFMSKKGWNVVMQDSVRRLNKNKLEYRYISTLDQIPKNSMFDIITLWHSIEHIHDLDNLFYHINRLLKKNGRLFIAVPNINAPEIKSYGCNWAPYDVPRHLYFFSSSTLNRLCNKYNYTTIRRYSLYQDTPYNIILSTTSFNFINIISSVSLLIKSIIKILLRGPMHSSSFLFICKKY